jgi:hypothetical protein
MGIERGKKVLLWVVAFSVSLGLLYGLDHLVMYSQGLPLGLDLTPAQ